MPTNSIKNTSDNLKVGIAQIAPVWLNRQKTIAKVKGYLDQAADENCQLVVFSEALVPGYPFWVERTDGARFNSSSQKEIHAHYLDQAVQIERGDIKSLTQAAAARQIAVYLGIIERPSDRGGHSLYCSLVYIDPQGVIQSVHRKLMPTYEERLVWSTGDGHGLQVHQLGAFTVGGLNCWENWMPLSRTALYALGEDLHVAVWPGSERNTFDITRFIAKESRSFVISASGLMRKDDISKEIPQAELIIKSSEDTLANGGSCIAGPDGEWVIKPVVDEERLMVGYLNHSQVRAERQNFDPAGHYARPDVTHLVLNRDRQSLLALSGEEETDK
jgi:nitrilase